MLLDTTKERRSRDNAKTQSGRFKRKMTVIPSWPTNLSGLECKQQKTLLNFSGGNQISEEIKKNANSPTAGNASSKDKKLKISINN